jgi:2-desacetyl-2-hydroxyethyl bacteriochlorophyllide A dehydrogenase
MRRHSLQFTAPYDVRLVEEPVPQLGPRQILVRTLLSAISPGTELLVYRGQWPEGLPVDASIAALAGGFQYPVKYGYSSVGSIAAIGTEVAPQWLGRTVFAFNPHESHFIADLEGVIPLPEDLAPETAALLPNMETAVTFLLDGGPLIGENVAVVGQGIVGLLTTALLAQYPVGCLATVDGIAARREASLVLGAHAALDPGSDGVIHDLNEIFRQTGADGKADLTYELSGNPAALNLAIGITGFSGRIVIGSWYGAKQAEINLGGSFHRSRMRIISSQVSTLSPALTGRWTTVRRMQVALRKLSELRTADLITHRFPVSQAAQAYDMLDRSPEKAIQVLLTYEDMQ